MKALKILGGVLGKINKLLMLEPSVNWRIYTSMYTWF